jgi:coniferyl-aldehyde dehydrogenase
MTAPTLSAPSNAQAAPRTDVPLRERFDVQRTAFMAGVPDYRKRIAALDALRDGLLAWKEELVAAVSADFGGRSREETLLLELFPLLDQIQHAKRHLRRWMKPRVVGSTWFLLPSRAYVVHQPLGIVGVLGAWNYQLLLTLGPVVDAIAAGNHVMLKPSEVTPRSADVIASIVAERFPSEYVTVVTGGPEIGAAFTSLPFDHLIFTGSTRVGHLVMRAASENLTPVTLELGGKSPAIVHSSYSLERAMASVLMGKLYNAGQTCVAPDYLLVPEEHVDQVEAIARRVVARLYPSLVANADYTRIVTPRHYERLTALVDDARERGARVVVINPANETIDGASRVFQPTLVFSAPDDATVMREEIFGPVLPIVSYRSISAAIAYVNARPRPLALYYFDHDQRRIDMVVECTISGGVCINDTIVHLGQHNLPFGGVGPSGMGHYHGYDGFERFSKKKGVMHQSRFSAGGIFRPPFGPRARSLIERLLGLAAR